MKLIRNTTVPDNAEALFSAAVDNVWFKTTIDVKRLENRYFVSVCHEETDEPYYDTDPSVFYLNFRITKDNETINLTTYNKDSFEIQSDKELTEVNFAWDRGDSFVCEYCNGYHNGVGCARVDEIVNNYIENSLDNFGFYQGADILDETCGAFVIFNNTDRAQNVSVFCAETSAGNDSFVLDPYSYFQVEYQASSINASFIDEKK